MDKSILVYVILVAYLPTLRVLSHIEAFIGHVMCLKWLITVAYRDVGHFSVTVFQCHPHIDTNSLIPVLSI